MAEGAGTDGELAVNLEPAPPRPSIHRVPEWIRDLNGEAYTPRLVPFGPYHHHVGEDLQPPMSVHKDKALEAFLRRTKQTWTVVNMSVENTVDVLMKAYDMLDESWRKNRKRFLHLMVRDGCFMLEVLLHNPAADNGHYAADDPIFGRKAAYMMPHIRRDMLLLENQLPLMLLQMLAEALPHPAQETKVSVQELIAKFLSNGTLFYSLERVNHEQIAVGAHILDAYRKCMLLDGESCATPLPFSAEHLLLYLVDIRAAGARSFNAINFDPIALAYIGNLKIVLNYIIAAILRWPIHTLSLPILEVDDSTLSMLLNLAAFERLHNGAGVEVNKYLMLMCSLVRSVEDVKVLLRCGVIVRGLGHRYNDDEAICRMFTELSEQAVLTVALGAPVQTRLYKLVTARCSSWKRMIADARAPLLSAMLGILSIYASILVGLQNRGRNK